MSDFVCEMCLCTETILDEISMPELTQKQVAQTYRLAMESSEEKDWKVINAAIMKRWGQSGLTRIKKLAWSGKCFERGKK